MRHRLWLLVWLVIVWIALWGEVSPANVLSGVAVAVVLVAAFPAAGPQGRSPFRPWRALVFGVHFLYKLTEANIVVAWEVITPDDSSVREGIVAVPVTGASDVVTTVVANAISLTPGTITLDVRRDPPTLFVHVLHLYDVDDLRRDVLLLEWLALRAFGAEEDLARAVPPSKAHLVPSEATRARMIHIGTDDTRDVEE